MKRPSIYQRHEDSLKAFVKKFNNAKDSLRLVMQIYNTENFRDDGVIVDTKSGKRRRPGVIWSADFSFTNIPNTISSDI